MWSGPMPASANTSASPSFAQQSPIAPRSSCFFAMTGDLWVFACGRTFLPVRFENAAIRSRFRSNASTSTRSAGVSSRSTSVPISGDGRGRSQMRRREVELEGELLDLLGHDDRAVARVVAVLVVWNAQLAQPRGVDVDAARGAARIVLADHHEQRHAHF